MSMLESFNPLLLIGLMGVMLIFGILCRAYIPFFQKFLVPASIIGGITGFIIVSLGLFDLKADMFKLFSFHFFNASFIAMGLTGADKSSDNQGSRKKTIFQGAMWLGIISSALIALQGMIGGGVSYLLNVVTGSETYEGLGMLLAHGYLQGPGQALAIGGAWQNQFGIPDAQTIALTFSAIGFLVASFIGVPLANWGLRKGYAANPVGSLEKDFLTGIKSKGSNESVGNETVHSANVGTFTVHLALIGVSYLVAYGFCLGMQELFSGTAMGKIMFGFFFIWGLLAAMVVRKVVDVTGHGHLIDNAQMKQFMGLFVDFLMIATMMAISVGVVMKYIVLISSVAIACTVFTLFFVLYFGRRIGKFDLERMLMLFGSGTGTIPSGLVLLRIVDPEFKTTAAIEGGMAQMVMMFFMSHIMFIAAILPESYTVLQAMGIWGITGIVCLIFLKVFRVWKKEKSF